MSKNSGNKKYNSKSEIKIPDEVINEMVDEYNDENPTFQTISTAIYKLNQTDEVIRTEMHYLGQLISLGGTPKKDGDRQ